MTEPSLLQPIIHRGSCASSIMLAGCASDFAEACALPGSFDPLYIFHASMSAKLRAKLAPEVNEPEPADPRPSVAASWGVKEVCAWVEQTLLQSFGDKGCLVAQQLQETFDKHFIDGAVLLKLQLPDWRALCPLVGVRMRLMECTEKLASEYESEVELCMDSDPEEVCSDRSTSGEGFRELDKPPCSQGKTSPDRGPGSSSQPSNPQCNGAKADYPRPKFGRCPAPLQVPSSTSSFNHSSSPQLSPRPILSPSARAKRSSVFRWLASDMEENTVHQGGQASPSNADLSSPRSDRPQTYPSECVDPVARTLTSASVVSLMGPRSPTLAQPVSAKMLRKRSRFSNQPIIMNSWRPDPSWSLCRRVWQRVLFQCLRCLNHFLTLQKMCRSTDVVLCLVPVIALYLCILYKIEGDYNPGLYMSSIIFPISFAVHQAYQRRETALSYLSLLKACAFSFHACLTVWADSMPGIPETYMQDSSLAIIYLFRCVRRYLTSVSEAEKEKLMHQIYGAFSCLSYIVDSLRLSGMPAPLLTRPLHDMREMLMAIEKLRVFSDYRTPSSIKCFVRIAPIAVAVTMAPYFARMAGQCHPAFVYAAMVLFFAFMRYMGNVQASLENPYMASGRLGDDDAINMKYLSCLPEEKKRRRGRLRRDESYSSQELRI